ncbi:hypothetical protein KQX54_005759 [Cotesia glomerata]|uniref:Uncharacterized protein n=1 Tax=Cotesia glomerata TaxID=32391 RepID=A0AAV7IQT3_COTGL|nr:hypothetical protein KQX54_005759 [Cotesia glomerata]
MCFKSNSNPVFISADLLSKDWNPGGNSWVVIDHKFQKQATGFNSAYPTYVLSFESIDYLKATINHFRKSTAWSIKSPFLIVERKSSCLSAGEVLQFMWKQDLMAVYYLCSDQNTTIVFTLIHLLSPFATHAPAPWVFFSNLTIIERNRPFTIWNTQKEISRYQVFFKKTQTKRIEERASFEFIDFDTLILNYMIVLGLLIWGLVAFGLELLFHKYEKRRRQTLIRRRYRMELRSQLRNVSSIEQIIPSNPGTSFGG